MWVRANFCGGAAVEANDNHRKIFNLDSKVWSLLAFPPNTASKRKYIMMADGSREEDLFTFDINFFVANDDTIFENRKKGHWDFPQTFFKEAISTFNLTRSSIWKLFSVLFFFPFELSCFGYFENVWIFTPE